MEKLNNRQVELLNYLMDSEDYNTYTHYSSILNVSNKTLQRDVTTLNSYLEKKNLEIEVKNGVGIKLINNSIATNNSKHKEKMSPIIQFDYRGLNHPRLIDVCINLLLYHDDPIDILTLQETYNLSNNLMSKDINTLSKYFSKYNITVVKKSTSIYLQGKEIDYRKSLVEIIIFVLDYNHSNYKSLYSNSVKFNNDTLTIILEMFQEQDIIFVNQLQKNIKELYNREFTEQEYLHFSIGLLVTVYRIKQRDCLPNIDIPENIQERKLYCEIIQFLESLQLNIDEQIKQNEAYFFYNYINSLMNLERTTLDYSEEFCTDFIDAYSYISDIDIRNHFLYDNLIEHLLLMFKRISTNTTILNPILESIQNKYPTLHSLTNILCSVLRTKYSLNEISYDEISFLVLYLNSFNNQENYNKIGIFCNMTKSVGNHIYSQIKHILPKENVEIIDTALHNIKFSEYNFIISTKLLNQEEIKTPYIYISPICDENDIQAIKKAWIKLNEKKIYIDNDLINTLNELMDLGVDVMIDFKTNPRIENYIDGSNVHSEKINNISYEYYLNQGEENKIIITEHNHSKRIIYNMSSLDYLLIATKVTNLISFSNNISLKSLFGRGE